MKKIFYSFIFLLAIFIVAGCGVKQETNNNNLKAEKSELLDETFKSEKQKDFSDLLRNKLYAKKYEDISIDTSQWKKFTSNKYGFSFKYPEYLEVIEDEEKFENEVSHVICVKESQYDRSLGCDIDFILYGSEEEHEFFQGINYYVNFFIENPETKKDSEFIYIEQENNDLLYSKGLHQKINFYNSDDRFFMIFAEPHFNDEIDDEDIVRGIIQSIEL